MLDLCFCSRGNRSTHSGKDGPQTPNLTSQRAHIALRSWRYVMATAWENSLMTDAPLMNSISTADFICGLAMSLQNCRDMTFVCSLSHRPLIPFARMLENFSCNSSCTSGCTGTEILWVWIWSFKTILCLGYCTQSLNFNPEIKKKVISAGLARWFLTFYFKC